MEINRSSDWKFPDIEDGKAMKYNWVVQNLGFKTDIGAFSYISTKRGVTIENKVQIRFHSSLYSTSKIDNLAGEVVLKQNCKIGSHTSILSRIVIGRNSKIGANSSVKKDIPSNLWCSCKDSQID
jgi:acetyltransferase-like isoleucine patch superfamily enzyme